MNRNPEVDRWLDAVDHPLDAMVRRTREIILGAEIPGEHPRLEGDGRLARTMRLADADELEAGRPEAVIRAWCDWRG